jgi:hypothetical protein
MGLATPADYIQVPGKVEVLIAVPSAYTSLFKLGESENGIQVRKSPQIGEVIGDRYGGQSGRPIERQFFGVSASFNLTMSRWDPVQLLKLETFGGLLGTAGTVPLATIGALLHRDRGIRFLLYCVRDPSLSVNFPCCTWTEPQESGRGTKYSNCSMNITAERAPEGYWHSAAVGIVYNADTNGIPDPYVPS